METDVAVTGLGLVTAAGVGCLPTWTTMCAGLSTAAQDASLHGLPIAISCAVPDFDASASLGPRLARRMDVITQMAVVAAREAVAMAGLDTERPAPERIAVVLGCSSSNFESIAPAYRKLFADSAPTIPPLSLPRSLTSTAAAEVAIDLGATGPNFTTASACASGTVAIGVARDLLRCGAADVVITGGAESMRVPIAAACFSQMGVLSRRTHAPAAASRPFDADRDGFVLGEGAGILVLERNRDALARRAPVLAHLSGYGAASDAYHPVAPHPDGIGITLALRTALQDADWPAADVDHVNAHGTGTALNDAVEARCLAKMFPHRPPVTAPKGVLGHAAGAAGAIEAALTVLTLHHRSIPPTANLDCLDEAVELDVVAGVPRPSAPRTAVTLSAAFGGQNAALAFRRP
ncbi:beta-ketoacyl-[acyl-carrier-protein] synthase family protein [Streptomyces sp. NPDC016562]|uniref:beta-ketoacyl-[acyl-carrier-protein] synthase family protein n=1 Tax=Streptomyces sp. NPDC016562 TaxID=3364966 RepID=UPI0037007F2B